MYICTIHHQCKHSFRVRNAEEEDQYILEEAHAHSTELVAVVSGEEDAPATAEDTDSKAKKSKKEKVKKEKVIKEEGDVAEDSDETVKELAHSCPKCGKGFKSKLGIKYHRENVCVERPEAKENEEGEALSSEPVVRSPAFKCSMCNKSFVSGLGYKYHIRHVCVQEPIFPCTKCGKECSSEAKLSKHVASCTATELVKKWAKRKSSGPDMVSLAAKHEMKSDEDGEPTVLSIAPQEESVVIEGNTGL